MMRLKIASVSLFSTFFALSVSAQQKTNVVCASKSDRSNWNWATDKDGNRIEVTGYHIHGRCGDTNFNRYITPRNSQLMFFVLDSESVAVAKSACSSDFYFQPAQFPSDIWYRFAEGENNKIVKIFDGHIQCLPDFPSKL
jgi:hypothetical protein